MQSRRLYWCKSGHGRFRTSNQSFDLEPHDLYVLPWGQDIEHLPNPDDPMYTGHVHVVPDYDLGTKWIPNVAHYPQEPICNLPNRRDALWPGFEGTVRLKIKTAEPLGLILDYAIRWYLETHGEDEQEGRSLGHLIVQELTRKIAKEKEAQHSYPRELLKMISYVNNGFYRSPTVAELAQLINRSRSHVLKLFSNHLGISPKSYIVNLQLSEARELLLSTNLRISEIGQSVGIPDPYHFSKLFRRHVGVAPSEYRQRHSPISRSSANRRSSKDLEW